MTIQEQADAIDVLVQHLKETCDAAVVMHRQGESADEVIESLLADGWTLEDQVDYVSGKRIRYMTPPTTGSNHAR